MAGAQDQELKLLGWWVSGMSPYVLRAQMALGIKGLSYDYLPEDGRCKSDLLLASNPVYKKVPVLIHAGRPVCESLLIVQYLDDALDLAGNGASILPADPYGRAVARFWAAYVDDKLFPSCIGILKTAKQQERADKVDVNPAYSSDATDDAVPATGEAQRSKRTRKPSSRYAAADWVVT